MDLDEEASVSSGLRRELDIMRTLEHQSAGKLKYYMRVKCLALLFDIFLLISGKSLLAITFIWDKTDEDRLSVGSVSWCDFRSARWP